MDRAVISIAEVFLFQCLHGATSFVSPLVLCSWPTVCVVTTPEYLCDFLKRCNSFAIDSDNRSLPLVRSAIEFIETGNLEGSEAKYMVVVLRNGAVDL